MLYYLLKCIEPDTRLRKQPNENDKEGNCVDTRGVGRDQPVWLQYEKQSFKRWRDCNP